MKSVLIVSGGGLQGQTLITLFRALGNFEIHVCDIGSDTIGRYLSDHYWKAAPIADRETFISSIRNYIHERQIDVVVPSTVFELRALAGLEDIGESLVLVSEPEALKIFMNKLETYFFLEQYNIPQLPRVDQLPADPYKLIAKEVEGFGGKGISIIENEIDFEKYNTDRYLIQAHIDDFEEISVDQFFGPHGMTSPLLRKRIKTTGGYAVISEYLSDAGVEQILASLLPAMAQNGAFGFYNLQFLKTKEGELFVNDINPRIGTSSALVHWRPGEIHDCLRGHKDAGVSHLPATSPKSGDRILRIVRDKVLSIPDLSEIKTIAFDLDDTLINHKKWCRRQAYNFIDSLDVAKLLKEEVRLVCDIVIEEHRVNRLIDILIEKFGTQLPGKTQLLELYRKCRPKEVNSYKDVEHVLKALKRKGYRLCILTNNPPSTQEYKISLLPFRQLFDSVHYAESIHKSKPAAECFQLLLKEEEKDLGHIAVVGDHPICDVYGAINAGCGHSFLIRREGGFLNGDTASISSTVPSDRYTTINSLDELLWYL